MQITNNNDTGYGRTQGPSHGEAKEPVSIKIIMAKAYRRVVWHGNHVY
jgi:hypothetical protein